MLNKFDEEFLVFSHFIVEIGISGTCCPLVHFVFFFKFYSTLAIGLHFNWLLLNQKYHSKTMTEFIHSLEPIKIQTPIITMQTETSSFSTEMKILGDECFKSFLDSPHLSQRSMYIASY